MSFLLAARKRTFGEGGESLEAFHGELSRRQNYQLQRDLLDRWCCCSRVNSAHLPGKKTARGERIVPRPGRVWFRLKPVQVTRACNVFSFRDAFRRSERRKKDKRVTGEVAASALQSFIQLIRRTHAEDDRQHEGAAAVKAKRPLQILGNTFPLLEKNIPMVGAEMRNGPSGILNVLQLPATREKRASRVITAGRASERATTGRRGGWRRDHVTACHVTHTLIAAAVS